VAFFRNEVLVRRCSGVHVMAFHGEAKKGAACVGKTV